VPFGSHVGQGARHVIDVGQLDRVGDQAGVHELLLLLDGIAALDRGSSGMWMASHTPQGMKLVNTAMWWSAMPP